MQSVESVRDIDTYRRAGGIIGCLVYSVWCLEYSVLCLTETVLTEGVLFVEAFIDFGRDTIEANHTLRFRLYLLRSRRIINDILHFVNTMGFTPNQESDECP